jgi:ABC-2 type transport system ATP-binding protein
MNDTTRQAAIEVAGLTKRYRNGTLANDAIHLRVPRGTALGLLGRNGAGKTTLVRQITGELQPTAGSIRVLGVDVVREHVRARELMGVVPQEAAPYEELTPYEHLAFFGRLRGLERREAARRADALVEALGLAPHRRTIARELSGGLKRKLLLGVALIGDPPVLVLDEPTTGLDPHARREIWAVLQGLRGQGRTILITTHYMDEAEELCDEVAIINGGRIYAQGTVDDLRSRCRSRYKATFGDGNGRGRVVGQSADEVLAELRRRGVEEFHLAKTSLEDLYLELTAEALEE